MNKISNLRDLLHEQSKGLYNAEKLSHHALTKLSSKATAQELKELIGKQIDQSKTHQHNLETVLTKFNAKPTAEKSIAVEAIVNQTNDLLKRSADHRVTDAALIESIQQLNHYKIAAYGTAASYATSLNEKESQKIFHDALEREKQLDKQLTQLAIDKVNASAKVAVATHA